MMPGHTLNKDFTFTKNIDMDRGSGESGPGVSMTIFFFVKKNEYSIVN